MGACVGTTVVCSDGNLCTDDYCDLALGCKTTNNALSCDDGSLCTSPDKCAAGVCGGTTVNCDDGNPCTADTCDPATGCANAPLNGTACGDIGVCMTGTCSPGSDINPGTSCKQIHTAYPAGATGTYWIDPNGSSHADKYQVFCEMTNWGGGWEKIDNQWAYNLLTVTNPNPAQGLCLLTAALWQTWDQWNGAPGNQHLCIGANASANWPSYTELRYEALVLTGYCGGTANFDLGTNCYSTNGTDDFCAGPAAQLKPPNTANVTLTNGVNSAAFTRAFTLTGTVSDFQIRSRAFSNFQAEGVQWKSGAVYFR